MSNAVLPALISAIVALTVAWWADRRVRNAATAAVTKEVVEDQVKLRIREIDAVEEFRDTLRETVKEQGHRIARLEGELERARLERLEHERERLDWYNERQQLGERLASVEAALEHEREEYSADRDRWTAERASLEARLAVLEGLLKTNGIQVHDHDMGDHGV